MVDNEVEKTLSIIMAEMHKTTSEKEVLRCITKEEYEKLYTINKNQIMIIYCLVIFLICGFCFFMVATY